MQNEETFQRFAIRKFCIQPSPFESGASGRTRTDEYEFTKLALLLLRHRGMEAKLNANLFAETRGRASPDFSLLLLAFSLSKSGALTWICTTNFRLRRAACRTGYTLRA